ncbi:RNA polymerase sigma-70 factor [Sunxiuqinia sp. sy24]|uniref:RNA polymerase sigma-70 factor n=1 Tax=Sunxiuqinia sp. sy24 TaxID=3461495 RepID=UPI00404572D4
MDTNRNKSLYAADGHLNLNQVFLQYSEPLFYFALKFVDEELAKDVVQDVFFKLWEDKSLTVKSSVSGLLFTMVRNKCLQHLEKQKVRSRYEETASIDLRQDEICFYSTGASSLIQQELQEQLQQVIDQLPEKCREVFVLSRFHDKRHKEIAAELGISIKMVEKHISRALKVIRIELKDYLPLLYLVHTCFTHQKNQDFFIS